MSDGAWRYHCTKRDHVALFLTKVNHAFMLPDHDRKNFDTLSRAFQDGSAALLEVQRVSDHKRVSAICAVGFDGETYSFTPFAILVEGNPFELFNPPLSEGGFEAQP